ncbi:MAG TPA: DUF4835 family protein [Bacteroidales bacterium]|jgi:hypothetical protein|nr:DUF4835 family protein [Bacteroidales bacterium]OPZ55012.1 MAG: hypothetical protein BWY89_01462 [Bacteroidetes bacterium ADurb.BinA012]HHU98278.1 DUF4835 family protein [Bacteroidales bacterium]HMT66403.1 DUF4835 family protein [Bacteroidales bacterium]HOC49452.1 DUF4835 family protein [Bacteroidales bacterium]
MIKPVKTKLLVAALLMALAAGTAVSQELYCNVQVSAQKIQGSNREVFQNMQRDIYEFMNSMVWTDNIFSFSERIECNLLINLDEQLSADEFRGTVQIQLSRPVYNTTYKSTVLNFVDNNFQFRYVEFQPLEFNPNSHTSNLVSVLAYYAYLLIGMDFDTYSQGGGTPYFQVAEKIVINAQNAPEQGWKPYDGSRNRNRYWLVKNILDSEYSGVRQFIYLYHLRGLDRMESDMTRARTEIYESLRRLQEVYRQRPDPFMYYMTVVLDAKADEIVNIFSQAFPEEKNRVVQVLTEIDPANETKYKKILTSNS